MKLEQFNNRNKKIIFKTTFITAIIFTVVGIIIQKTYASFQETKTFNVIEGTVKYEGTGDVYVAAYVDGVKTDKFPSKVDYSYDNEQSNCTNDGVLNFDLVSWKVTVEADKPNTKCNLYFKSRPNYDNKIYQMMVRLEQEANTQLAYDETVDNNLRYIGANPNNYVTFNNEHWRIIGSFKDIDDGTGKIEWRTKIIRNQSIGNKKWDAANTNDWNTADIKDELNGTYLNGLNTQTKEMIGNTKWAIGKTTSEITATNFYTQERGGTTWIGKIGLMYPSDYGYAVGGDNRMPCLNYTMNTWDRHSECKSNDWIFNGADQWTLTAYSTGINHVFHIYSASSIYSNNASTTFSVRPALYLSSNVYITSGSGTSTDPYQLALQ